MEQIESAMDCSRSFFFHRLKCKIDRLNGKRDFLGLGNGVGRGFLGMEGGFFIFGDVGRGFLGMEGGFFIFGDGNIGRIFCFRRIDFATVRRSRFRQKFFCRSVFARLCICDTRYRNAIGCVYIASDAPCYAI